MATRYKSIPWRHFIDEENKEIYVVVQSAITALGACTLVRKKFPGSECHYASDAFIDRLEEEREGE